MPFPENTPTPDDLPGLSPQEIAELPVELLADPPARDRRAPEARQGREDPARCRADASATPPAPPRSGRRRPRTPARSGSTTAISPWSPTCRSASSGTRPGWPPWSSASAPRGTTRAEYVDIAFKVPERKYAAWPEAIRQGFEPARTVKTGALKVEIQPQGGDA